MKTFVKLINEFTIDYLTYIPYVSNPTPYMMERYALSHGYKEYKSSECPQDTMYHHHYKEVEEYITDEWVKFTTDELVPQRVAELHAKLEETDYVAAKLAEVDGEERIEMLKYYSDILANRKAWREEIRSLEN